MVRNAEIVIQWLTDTTSTVVLIWSKFLFCIPVLYLKRASAERTLKVRPRTVGGENPNLFCPADSRASLCSQGTVSWWTRSSAEGWRSARGTAPRTTSRRARRYDASRGGLGQFCADGMNLLPSGDSQTQTVSWSVSTRRRNLKSDIK